MGLEHSVKDDPDHTRRCPCCGHISTVYTQDAFGHYFYCQNPRCSVEKIYDQNTVEVTGEKK